MRKIFFVVLCLSFFFVACSRREKKSLPSDVLATVSGEPITLEKFKSSMARRRRSNFSIQEQKESLLEEMVRSEALYQAAKKEGYHEDPEILAKFKRFIINQYQQDSLEAKLDKITVTDKEIEQYYHEYQSDFITPKQVRAAIIQISVPPGASEEKRTQLARRAETVRAEALQLDPEARSFGSIAVKYSDDQATRYLGGDTGWLKEENSAFRFDEKVAAAVFSLSEPGRVSPVITTSSGFYLVRLMEIKESAPINLARVKDRIRHQLMKQRKEKVKTRFYNKLKKKFTITVNKALLSSIEPPEGSRNNKISPPALPRE